MYTKCQADVQKMYSKGLLRHFLRLKRSWHDSCILKYDVADFGESGSRSNDDMTTNGVQYAKYKKSDYPIHFIHVAVAFVSLRVGMRAHCRDNYRRRSSTTILHLFWHNGARWLSCQCGCNGGRFSRKGAFADSTITAICRGSSSGTCGGHHLPAS